MKQSSLSKLPAELICLVLSAAPSTDDLLSLILTHSLFNDCFREFQRAILSALAHNICDGGILATALGSFQAANLLRSFDWSRGQPPRSQIDKTVDAFFDVYDTAPPDVLELSQVIPFLRYQRVVESFVHDYVSRHMLRHDSFQLIRRLAERSCRRDHSWLQPAFRQCAPSPWEFEEILCVQQHLIEQLETVYDQVEDEYIQSVLASTQEAACLGGDPDATRWYSPNVAKWSSDHPSYFLQTDSRDDDSAPHEDRLIFWETEKKFHHDAMEHIHMSGLTLVRHFLDISEPKARREATIDHFGELPPSLLDFVQTEQTLYREELQDKQDGKVLTFEGDALDKCNLGWVWENRYRLSPSNGCRRIADLRSRGLVFWDHARLESLQIIKEPRPKRIFAEDLLPVKLRERAMEKTVEERLVEMGLVEDRGEVVI